jgi:hypothetical protein
MKKKILLISAVMTTLVANNLHAQWNGVPNTVLTTTNSNVGIGTTTPDSKAHILSGYGVLSGGGICTYSGTTALKIRWMPPDVMSLCNSFTNTPPNIIDVHSYSSFPMPSGSTAPLLVMNHMGNVGIGIAPNTSQRLNVGGRLGVSGSTTNDLVDIINNQNNVGAGSSVIWAAYKWGSTQNNNPMLLQLTAGFPGGGSDRFVVKNNGEVIIGDASCFLDPNKYRLYVEKGILTERLKVALKCTADWADYVFEPGYQLRPLEEVEQFTKKNKHLPGVPSAAQLIKNGGIDVNEMLAKQMEKIEELTLYMIQVKKENKELKAEIETLKNKQ